MRRTYAYNSIIFGFLLGALVYASTESIALGIVVCLAVSVVGFIIIRLIENAIDKGVDKLADKATEAYRSRKSKQQPRRSACAQPQAATQFPASAAAVTAAPQYPRYQQYPQTTAQTYSEVDNSARTGSRYDAGSYTANTYSAPEVLYCIQCGSRLEPGAHFCTVCGSSVNRLG